MPFSKKTKGLLALVGCFIVNLVSGTINLWGAVSLYFASYYHGKDHDVSESDLYLAYTLSYIIESFAFIIASYICIKFGCKIAAAVGTLFGSLFLLVSSFASNYFLFCVLYGTYAGVISGMLNMPIIWACWEFYPKNIGLVSSFGISAYSLGPTIFGLIWTSLINPTNEPPFITFPNSKGDDSHYFGSSVYDNVPSAIRWMSLIYFVSSLLGIYMIRSEGGAQESAIDQRTLTLKDVGKQKNFWLLSLNCFFSFAFYAYFVSEYKNFGHTKIKDDHFLSYLGSTGFLVGGVSRLLWGFAIDKYDWKKISYIAIISQVFICMTIYYIASVRVLYFIWSTLGFIFGSSTYLIIIVACKIIYPHDDWILSWSFLGFTLLAISLWGVELFIWPYIGYQYTFWIMAGTLLVSLKITHSMPKSMPIPIEEEHKEEQIEENLI